MRSKHRHNHRRYVGRRRTERNRSKLTTVLIIIFTLAVIVGSVFLGNHLKKKAEISELNREELPSDTGAPDTGNISGENVEDVILGIRPPESFDASYVSHKNIEEAAGSIADGSAVTVLFRDGKGELLYSSPAAQKLGAQSEDTANPTATDMIAALKAKNCYISAYLYVSELSEENAATSSMVRAFEGALISEIAYAGVNEIVLLGFNASTEEDVRSLCAFSAEMRKKTSLNIPVGVLLPYSFFTLEIGSELCREISRYFEFIAVDYTDAAVSEDLTVSDVIAARIDSMQMYFSRYSVRIVLDTEIEEYESVKQTIADKFVYSQQRIYRAEIFAE